MKILDGRKIADVIEREIAEEIKTLPKKPGLAFLLIGDNSASNTYVKAKEKACARVGIRSLVQRHSATIAASDLVKEIDKLNRDPAIHGILVQLPLPPHIDPTLILSAIDPAKDVDGFHPVNAGKLLLGLEGGFVPCTPAGIQELLTRSRVEIEGKHVVIVGRSNIVGKPLSALLSQKKPHANATVTLAHSRSHNLKELTLSADILIAAIGKPHFITHHMVKPGAVVVDVGINRLPSGKLAGDVAFEEVHKIASAITPVPGGIGPMTIALLLRNTLRAYKK
jgi:methylenetetrahydrofolate dehydrogenase (NADP+) / methenyltetrahydrofolate cyclohydrolase